MKNKRDGKPTGQRVYVYFNLHRKLWSVRALDGPHKGRVIAHKRGVVLQDVSPRVSQAGRKRVLRERKKNVHAGLVGYWVPFNTPITEHMVPITYNPYKYESFVYVSDESAYTGTRKALLLNRQVRVSV
jgi:hypothetical protein